MIYNVILFDLDGTLADPKTGITKSIQYALKKFGINVDDLDKFETFIGPPLLESFKKHYSFNDIEARKAVDYYREYYSQKGIYENSLYIGIPSLLKELWCREKKLILATSKPTVYADRILKNFGITKYFSSTVGSKLDCTFTSKNEIIKFVLLSLTEFTKNEVVMVGDREDDVIGARYNEIDSIGVTYGCGSGDEIRKVKPK